MVSCNAISGGLLGIFDNYGAYQRWVRTNGARTKMLDMCDMIDDPTIPKSGKHGDLEPAQIKRSEEAVQNVLVAISHFTNPWRIPDKENSIRCHLELQCLRKLNTIF